jgi:hypothetical protein
MGPLVDGLALLPRRAADDDVGEGEGRDTGGGDGDGDGAFIRFGLARRWLTRSCAWRRARADGSGIEAVPTEGDDATEDDDDTVEVDDGDAEGTGDGDDGMSWLGLAGC